jgi:mannose-6-phosphate isomerase-like protein (cupin superfamily)
MADKGTTWNRLVWNCNFEERRMIEQIEHNGIIFAIIIRNNYSEQGVTFCTPNEYSQQLAYMSHPKGKIIQAHIHNPVKREVLYTKEVLFIKKGKLKANFYTDDKKFVDSAILESGDCILLASGGHGFECLDDVEMIEVKQGPYAGEQDKTRFEP